MIVVVSDTSAISALLQIDEIDILRHLYGQILIPTAVATELQRSHSSIPDFIRTVSVKESPVLQTRRFMLDVGEACAITLAEQVDADLLLIDEKKGRAVAKQAGLQYMGLVGSLIEAKRRGIIQDLSHLLGRITAEAGFRLSPQLKTAVLNAVGEAG